MKKLVPFREGDAGAHMLFSAKYNSLGTKRAISRGGFADRPIACECNHTLVSAWRFFADSSVNCASR